MKTKPKKPAFTSKTVLGAQVRKIADARDISLSDVARELGLVTASGIVRSADLHNLMSGKWGVTDRSELKKRLLYWIERNSKHLA